MAKIHHIIFLTAAILLEYQINNKVNAIHIKSKDDDEMSIADLTASFKE
jgi:hypothetical protein